MVDKVYLVGYVVYEGLVFDSVWSTRESAIAYVTSYYSIGVYETIGVYEILVDTQYGLGESPKQIWNSREGYV